MIGADGSSSTAWTRRIFRRRRPPVPYVLSAADPAKEAVGERPVRLLVLGHSHIHALMDAQTNRNSAVGAATQELHFLQLLEPAFTPNVEAEGGTLRLKPALAEKLLEETCTSKVPLIISSVSGNEYHFIGLASHPRPFDFVLPSAANLPLRKDAEIIPFGLMQQTLSHAMEYAVAVLRTLRAATSLPTWQVQSPPPIASEAHILAHSTHFKDMVERYGIVPAPVRWKLWRLQSDLYRDACEAIGINFLPTPPEALDPDGFLAEAGWNPDPTHANSWYGEFVLRQIDALCDARALTIKEARQHEHAPIPQST